jgi:transposase
MSEMKERKPRIIFTPEQRLEYAKLMVNEGYSNKKIKEISGAGDSAITRWKRQYLSEINGKTPPQGKKALTPDKQRIQELEKQLWRAQRDNEILKKATAFFVRDNSKLSS